ncbi:LPS translocon maturation chaperone LptM [Gilvimarinus japonicus]
MTYLRLLCATALICLCTGCGQQGPLYLPAEDSAPSESTPAD